jgi:nitrogen fixation NifU-like protein
VSEAEQGGAPSARVQALYQELILDHYRRPRNRGALPDADGTATLRNPLCGDQVTTYVRRDGGVVRDARFAGQGCSIAQATASMLTGALRGLSDDEAAALLARVGRVLRGDAEAARAVGEPLHALAAVARFPARVPCALLPARAFARALGLADGADSPRAATMTTTEPTELPP